WAEVSAKLGPALQVGEGLVWKNGEAKSGSNSKHAAHSNPNINQKPTPRDEFDEPEFEQPVMSHGKSLPMVLTNTTKPGGVAQAQSSQGINIDSAPAPPSHDPEEANTQNKDRSKVALTS
ncbi:unnamed protein product, partial [Owenia fusiformis]